MSLEIDTSTLIHDDVVMEISPEEIRTPTESNQLRRFQETFELHMPSARKPKRYDHVGVLLLSFDCTTELDGMKNMDVSEEVSPMNHSTGTQIDLILCG
jgi:hypothetical protein